jgi:hypothetical protein
VCSRACQWRRRRWRGRRRKGDRRLGRAGAYKKAVGAHTWRGSVADLSPSL